MDQLCAKKGCRLRPVWWFLWSLRSPNKINKQPFLVSLILAAATMWYYMYSMYMMYMMYILYMIYILKLPPIWMANCQSRMAGDLSEYDPALDDGGASGMMKWWSKFPKFATVTLQSEWRMSDGYFFLGRCHSFSFNLARHSIFKNLGNRSRWSSRRWVSVASCSASCSAHRLQQQFPPLKIKKIQEIWKDTTNRYETACKTWSRTFCLAELRKLWLILAVGPPNFSGTEYKMWTSI